MKTPFTLESWLKDKSQKVETRDGRQARIICVDAVGKYPIVALITLFDASEVTKSYTNNGLYHYDSESPLDLLLIASEPELSEFEKELSRCLCDSNVRPEEEDYDKWAKEYAPALLAIARKELCEQVVDHTKEAYENGKSEALKDLPKWRKEQDEMELVAYGIIGGGVASQENPRVYLNGHSIDLYSLKKLPGFNE